MKTSAQCWLSHNSAVCLFSKRSLSPITQRSHNAAINNTCYHTSFAFLNKTKQQMLIQCVQPAGSKRGKTCNTTASCVMLFTQMSGTSSAASLKVEQQYPPFCVHTSSTEWRGGIMAHFYLTHPCAVSLAQKYHRERCTSPFRGTKIWEFLALVVAPPKKIELVAFLCTEAWDMQIYSMFKMNIMLFRLCFYQQNAEAFFINLHNKVAQFPDWTLL